MNRGRPKGKIQRNNRVQVRVTDECESQLDYLTGITGESKAEIIEKAIRIKYHLHNSGADFDEK